MKKAELSSALSTVAVAILLACSRGTAQADPQHSPSIPSFPKIALPGMFHGEEAIANLAGNLPAVAASYGHTPDQLRGMLRSDATLHVDEHGRLLYLETALPEPTGSVQGPAAASATAPYPLANTFLLHSRPGSKRVIFLDFDGYVLTGTAWNTGTVPVTLNCPPWDIDGNPGVFGDNERTIIQGIWQRVAEDYRPFDVDVTTEDPGDAAMNRTDSADEYFGTRVLISPISSYFGNYGGIAYIGVFDSYPGSYYKPALVFPEMLANGEKYIAEAASHETGHNVGLNHDGTPSLSYYDGLGSGETGWAPIMGVGYYKNLTQWSKGEYPDANNTEDDLAVIQSNGLAYRPDDHGNTTATATVLPSGSTLNAFGVIERNTDVDVFAFAAQAGPVSIDVRPAYAGNLDILAELRNGAGDLIATANPIGFLSANITTTVPSTGSYYLFVRGTGQTDALGTYSNYGSMGAYTVSGTVSDVGGAQSPIASISVTPTSGAPGLQVTCSGSDSSDPDGVIVSYQWNFGDNSPLVDGATAQHTFVNSGSYTVTLKVTDDQGLSAQASTTVVVNSAPTASFTTAPSGLSVNFTGTALDSDGTIASYRWNFGDGGTSSSISPSHTYSSAGTYTVTLTVTDNLGATGSSSTPVSVQQDPSTVMHVQSIVLSVSGNSVVATVTVVNGAATPVPVSGATVTGTWSGVVTGNASGKTSTSGVATLSKVSKKTGTFSFTVTGVSKSGYTYNAGASVTQATKP